LCLKNLVQLIFLIKSCLAEQVVAAFSERVL
jgi:hypothetical protein